MGATVNFSDQTVSNGTLVLWWIWSFGDGDSSFIQNPNHSFNNTGSYTVVLTVNNGCEDTVSVTIDINTDIIIPNIITPNGDNKNDFFEIKNLLLSSPQNNLSIFNRWGNKVFETSNYTNNWNGDKLTEGTYFYVLTLSDGKKNHGMITLVK